MAADKNGIIRATGYGINKHLLIGDASDIDAITAMPDKHSPTRFRYATTLLIQALW